MNTAEEFVESLPVEVGHVKNYRMMVLFNIQERDAQWREYIRKLGKQNCECSEYHKNSPDKESPQFAMHNCSVCDFVKDLEGTR